MNEIGYERKEPNYTGQNDEDAEVGIKTKELISAIKEAKADPENVEKQQILEQKKMALEMMRQQWEVSPEKEVYSKKNRNAKPLAGNQGVTQLQDIMQKLGK